MTDTLMNDAPAPPDATAGGQQPTAADAGQVNPATGVASPESQSADTPEDAGKSKEPAGAPEKYDFKPPEGRQFDETVIAQFSEVAKELNLSNESAQKVLDKMAPVIQSRQMEQIEGIKTQWADSAKADKEIGGAGLNENLAVAKKSLDAFGTPALKNLLNESGLGNHPEVIRFFYRAGKAISEDKIITGGSGGNPEKSLADRLYGNT